MKKIDYKTAYETLLIAYHMLLEENIKLKDNNISINERRKMYGLPPMNNKQKPSTLEDMVLEKQEEIERLNNIINELENYIKVELKDVIPMWNLKTHYSFGESTIYEYILNKLQELKGSDKGVISELTAITPEYMKHRIEEEAQQYQQEIERLNKLISQREKKWEKWTTEKTILSTKMSDYLCKYQNLKREYTKQIKLSTDRKKEVERLSNIIKEAREYHDNCINNLLDLDKIDDNEKLTYKVAYEIHENYSKILGSDKNDD